MHAALTLFLPAALGSDGRVMPLCLAVTGVTVAMLATDVLSLIWARSVEKTEWREEWRVDGDRLTLVSATIGGSGAGIDPPANAMPAGNGWRYVPSVAHVPVLRLSLSPFAGDYGLCWHHDCRMLAEMLPAGTADPLELSACRPSCLWRHKDRRVTACP